MNKKLLILVGVFGLMTGAFAQTYYHTNFGFSSGRSTISGNTINYSRW